MIDLRICVSVEVADNDRDFYEETGAVILVTIEGVAVGDGTQPALVEALRRIGFDEQGIADKVQSVNEILADMAEAEIEETDVEDD